MDIIKELEENPFLLAPMAGITDSPFRSFMKELGCGMVCTELVSATGLKYKSQKTKKLLSYSSAQHPVGAQIFGYSDEDLSYAAKYCEDDGFDFIDLNLGCPVPKVVKKGAGSALLKDLVRLSQVLRVLKASVDIPVTIKIRTGWDSDTRNAHEVTDVAFNEGISLVSIHGRTRAQAYTGRADWDYIKSVKETSKVPVIGNGDLVTAQISVNNLKSSGCDAVMIGRGCLKNPWIFLESNNLLNGIDQPINRDFLTLINKLKKYLEPFYEERIQMLQVKKFCSWFSAGYPDSSRFRKQLFQAKDMQQLDDIIGDYYANLGTLIQKDTSDQPFLMGGHG